MSYSKEYYLQKAKEKEIWTEEECSEMFSNGAVGDPDLSLLCLKQLHKLQVARGYKSENPFIVMGAFKRTFGLTRWGGQQYVSRDLLDLLKERNLEEYIKRLTVQYLHDVWYQHEVRSCLFDLITEQEVELIVKGLLEKKKVVSFEEVMSNIENSKVKTVVPILLAEFGTGVMDLEKILKGANEWMYEKEDEVVDYGEIVFNEMEDVFENLRAKKGICSK